VVALAAWEALVAVYELVRELIGDTSGKPVGDQVTSKVDDLSTEVARRLTATANGLDRLRGVIISDYGRLKALGSVADGPGWSIDVPSTTTTLTTAANAFFSSQLMPIAFRPYELRRYSAVSGSFGTTESCFISVRGALNGHVFRGAPASSWLNWHRGDRLDSDWSNETQFSERDTPVWVLGEFYLRLAGNYSGVPEDLSDAIFRSQGQGGYGVHLHRFLWEQYSPALPGFRYQDPEDWNNADWRNCI
jgi:hypothetical protein